MIPTIEDFRTYYSLKHPIYTKVPTFKYYNFPVMGLGKQGKKFIEIDKFIEPKNFDKIYEELIRNEKYLQPYIKGLVVNGVIPKEHNNNIKSIDSYLLNQNKYIDWDYENDVKELPTLSKIKSYFYNKFNIVEAWQGVCHLRNYTNYENKHLPTSWIDYAKHFPLLREFVDSLPFKSLGYAVFFISNGNNRDPAMIHRDTFHRSHHKSNFINIMFDQKPRPFFVYDTETKVKHYVSEKCCMYYFNEADPHGVDIEPTTRYMLRVEGIFEDWFGKLIGLNKHDDYYESFDYEYDLPQSYLKNLTIYGNTDI